MSNEEQKRQTTRGFVFWLQFRSDGYSLRKISFHSFWAGRVGDLKRICNQEINRQLLLALHGLYLAQMYKTNPTQEERILDLLQERGRYGVHIYELMMPKPQGLGIAQYNARIFGLRKKGYDIRNDTPGHFYLHTKPYQSEIFSQVQI